MSRRTCTIYGLRSGDEWIYVGRSVSVRNRLYAHRARGVQFDSVVSLAVVPLGAAIEAETGAIKALSPKLNRTKSGGGMQARLSTQGNATAVLTASCSKSFKKRVEAASATIGRKTSELVRIALREYLENHAQ